MQIERAAKFAMTEPIKQAARFETVMAKVSSVLEGSTTKQIQELGDEILEMTRKFPKSKEELGTGLFNILQAGVEDSADAMLLLETSTKAAVGGVTEVGTASKVMTQIMNAYNLTAEETVGLMDEIFVGAQMGSAEFEDLATSMGNVLNSAAFLGVEIPEVVAGIETMVNAGLSADEASTALNRLFMSIIQASKGTGEAADVAKQLGLEYNATALRSKGLQQFMADLVSKVGDNEVAMQALTQDVRGFRAATTIAGKGAGDFNTMLAAMEDRVGALDEAYAKNADTLENFRILAQNELDVILTKIGQDSLPALKESLEEVKAALNENREEIIAAGQALMDGLVAGIEAVIENAPAIITTLNEIARAAGGVAKVLGVLLSIPTAGEKLGDATFQAAQQHAQSLGPTFRGGFMVARPTPLLTGTLSSTGGGARGFTGPDLGISTSDLFGGGGGGSDKAAKERLKLLETQRKLELDIERDRLEFMLKELELRRDAGELTKEEERTMERLAKHVDAAFDIRNARDFEELLEGMGDATEDLAKEFDTVAGRITKAKEAMEDMTKDAAKRMRDLQIELSEFRDEAAAEDEERLEEQARTLAETLLKAKKAIGGSIGGTFIQREEEGELDNFDAMRSIEDIEKLLAPDAENTKLRAALEEQLAIVLQLEKANAAEKVQIEERLEQEKIEAKRAAKEKELQMGIELEKAVTEGRLQEFYDANEAELSEKQRAHAEELLSKHQALQQELLLNQQVQQQITDAMVGQIAVREAASQAFVSNEVQRLNELRSAALSAAAAINRARTGSRAVGAQRFAGGGIVHGPGGPTDDLIHAMLSDGEGIIRTRAVDFYGGKPFIDAINNMQLKIPRFANGGVVSNSVNNSRSTVAHFHYHGDTARVAANPRMMRWQLRKAG